MSSGAGGRGRRAARERGDAGGEAAEEGPVGIPFPEHSAALLASLNAQRLSGALCDVLLVAQEREFHAHRSVLAACSSYFHKLFTSGLAADRQSVYAIDFVRAEALAALLDFAYTATLTVSHSSVSDILGAARLLEISPVQDVCTHLLDTKVLSPPAGSEQGDDEDDGERVQSGEARARDYLELFLQGAHWGSGCSTPELRDPPTHLHFSQPNGSSNGPVGHAQRYSPLAQAPPPSHEEVPDEEERRGGRGPRDSLAWSSRGDGEEAPPLLYLPAQNGHYYQEAGLEAESEAEPGSETGRGSASALLQQMMESIEQQKGEGPEVEGEEPDVEFYLKYFNSVQQEEAAAMSHALWATRPGGATPNPATSGERKMRSKAFQKCPICAKVIQGAGKLPRHIRTHTGEKPYECAICKVRFTRQDKLKVHMRKHTGEKPYLCTQCGTAFAHNYDLKNHMRVHTGLRPYQCSSCFKTFVRSDHLHRHLKKDGCNGVPSRRGRKPRLREPGPPEAPPLLPPVTQGARVARGRRRRSNEPGSATPMRHGALESHAYSPPLVESAEGGGQ